jgi:hypothetical protein
LAGQTPHDVYALADVGTILKVLVELLDSGAIDEEKFIREAREAVLRLETILGGSGDVGGS